MRLFCFPNAGGGAAQFLTWRSVLPPFVDLCPVQLPGRETRINDAPHTEMPPLVAEISDALHSYVDIPCAFFGHSLGALVAFEVARRLVQDTGAVPLLLMVAACRAPHVPDTQPPIDRRDDGCFLEEVQKRYQAVPAEIMDSPDALAFFTPLLKADFALFESYDYTDAPPLSCPIECYAGDNDRTVAAEDLDAWKLQTDGGFELHWFSGDHFFVHSQREVVLDAIGASLSRTIAGAD